MKEIDKIRIRQWNQDNPYIQMKNLENAQAGWLSWYPDYRTPGTE